MNNSLNKAFIFIAGAVIGSVVTWKLVKTKYEQIANDEIESVKERFRDREMTVKDVVETFNNEVVNIDISLKNKDIDKCNDIIDKNGYRNYSTKKDSDNKIEEKEEDKEMEGPYVISPEEFDESEYETETLTYYADGILTDLYDNIIDEKDIDGLIGKDSLNHFGEFEDDTVFVRNDEKEIDYEILRDDDKYYSKYPSER